MKRNMKEEFIYYLWESRLLSLDLKTTEDDVITIISVGNRNYDSGADFVNARIKIGETLWAGQVEIMDATFEFVEDGDTFIAEAMDVTDLLGTEALVKHQTEKVSFTNATAHANGLMLNVLQQWSQ